jgi:DNA-binding winged helix-turn-helix (wHTH) protein
MLAGKDVAVGSRAFDLLDLLVAARDSVVSRDEIMKSVRPDTLVGKTDHNVQVSKPLCVLEAAAVLAIPGRGLYLAMPAHYDL